MGYAGVGLALLFLAVPALAQTGPVPAPGPAAIPTPGPLAPNYRPFKVDLGFGFANIYDQKMSGAGMSLEPKFNFHDHISGGFRVDLVTAQGGVGDAEFRQQFIAAGLVKVDYFPLASRTPIRPWTGLGIGRYSLNGQQIDTDDDPDSTVEYPGGSYYGVAAQAGIELAVFRFSVTYNKLFGDRVVVVNNATLGRRTERYSSDYVTFEMGIRLGGGRIRGR